jgi:predicted dehydrogenase
MNAPKATGDVTPLKIGLIGAGSSATNIATTITTMPDLELAAICDINEDAAQKLADQFSIPIVITAYHDLLAQPVDFVVVSLPHGLHKQVTIDCLEAGKHVLVEKPIATSVEDAEAMIASARDHGLKLGVHFQNRFIDAVQEAKKLIDGGSLGRILQASVSVMWYRDTEYYTGSSWRGTWASEGGGSLINQAIHPIDQMLYLVGDVTTVFGAWGHLVHYIEVDDNSCAAFVFQSGAFGTIQTSTSTKAAFPAKLTIFGSEGGLEIEGNILSTFNIDGKSERVDYAAMEGGQVASATDPKKFSPVAHGRLMADFAAAIREDRDPLVTGEEGLRSIKLIRAVYESNGERVVAI